MMSKQTKHSYIQYEAQIAHKLRKTCLRFFTIALMVWLLASCGDTSSFKSSVDSNDASLDNYSDISEEDIEDFSWQEEFEDMYMEENMFYNRADVDEERFFFRLSCIKNRPANTSLDLQLGYEDIMRNIYDYDGELYGFYGSVAWVDRNGFSTSMLIRTGGNEKLVNCFADTDIPVVEGDWISVFGTLYPSNYTLTNEYGNQRIIDCPGLNVQDYYEGISTYDWDLKKSGSVEGAPNLPDWLREYWFRNEGYFNSHGGSVILTENTIDGHPYTVCRYTFLEKTAKLVLYIRFDEAAQYYKENTYTVIELEYNRFNIYSGGEDGSFEPSIYNADGNLYSTLRAIEQWGIGYCTIDS